MGSGTLTDRIDGNVIDKTWANDIHSAIKSDQYPRNSSGVVTNEAGALGSSTYKFKNASIKCGYWSAGDIKMHHTYNGLVAVDQGWFPCNGSVINEANYNAIHGAGSWATYIGTSLLDGLYSPDMTDDTYPAGAASTTQDGSAAITKVGDADNQHDHDIGSHGHLVFRDNGNSADTHGVNSSGNEIDLTGAASSTGVHIAETSSGTRINNAELWTTKAQPSCSTEDSRPKSIEVIFYIRII